MGSGKAGHKPPATLFGRLSVVGPPHQGEVVLRLALQTLKALGIPVAVHKTQGPTTGLTFLGILIDTHTFELRLPLDKLMRLQKLCYKLGSVAHPVPNMTSNHFWATSHMLPHGY